MELSVARAIKKKTQWGLTKETGINQSKISLIEHGYVEPSDQEKAAIAQALGLGIDEICWPERTPNRTQGFSY